MPNPGDLAPSTEGGWMAYPPSHCPAGHPLRPGQITVGHQPCSCRGGHTTWRCECDAVTYGPPIGDGCRVLNGPGEKR